MTLLEELRAIFGDAVVTDRDVLEAYCRDLDRMREACESAGATRVLVTSDEAEGRLLLEARRAAYPALERLGQVLTDDVAVPVLRLPDMLRRIECVAKDQSITIATVAHAGDGNLHPAIIFDPADSAAERRARRAYRAIAEHAIALGGTITGEHGVGSLKVDLLALQLSEVSLEVHAAIKRALDPQGILNPGKILARPLSP